MLMKLLKLFLLASFSCLLINTTSAQNNTAFVPCQEMPNIIQNFEADFRAINAFYSPGSNYYGRGNADGNEIGSPDKTNRLDVLYKDYLLKLNKLDFNNLPQECKVDYILFKRDLNNYIEKSNATTIELNKIKQWFPFADSIYALEKLRRRGTVVDAKKIAWDWHQIALSVIKLQSQLKKDSSLSLPNLFAATNKLSNLKATLVSIYKFYNGYDPLFTWWVPSAYTELDTTLNNYQKTFTQNKNRFTANDKSGIVGQPAGREEILRQLKYEMIPYSPDELIGIANKEFAWCEAEMLKATKEMGLGTDWKAALEKVKNTYVEPGKQPAMILGLYNESVDFIKKHDLITLPPLAEETWGMDMMSPERQRIAPFFLGGKEIIVSYPTNSMSEDEKLMSMRGNNPHFSRATVHHELLAGHNLEDYMKSRYRTYRHFETPFWIEGWSLYWELLLWDEGFPKSPEDRVGMLFWHMHRCARIIFSLNYHLGKWTPQQCIDFLVDKVGHERANAEGEVRRSFEGGYSPLYQLAYLTGGRQFYALKNELVDTKKMTYKEMNDAIMHLSEMPIEMIRAILTNYPLDKDYATKWRFYDGIK